MKDVIAGLPQWVFSERFDIQARAASQNPTLDEMRAMLRSLLRDRFKLQAHYEDAAGPGVRFGPGKSRQTGPLASATSGGRRLLGEAGLLTGKVQ